MVRKQIPSSAEPNAAKLARELLLRFDLFSEAVRSEALMVAFRPKIKTSPQLLIIRFDDPGYCGTLGCATVVFKQIGDDWTPVIAENFDTLHIRTRGGGKAQLVTRDLHDTEEVFELD